MSRAQDHRLPVFLHSSFRTSSTWLWTKFRADPRALAYNEIFNEILARLTVESARTHDPGSWRSGHPATSPYFLEYLPLIGPTGGVSGYDRAMAMESFVPQGGVGGDISAEERRHVARLIDLAWECGKIPVLADTRTLGRLAGLKRAFGGTHVFLVRNLLHQWNSYSDQHRAGNPFFMETIRCILLKKNGDKFIALLFDYMVSRSGYSVDRWLSAEKNDDLFTVFFSLHLYLAMMAWQVADLTIDVNEISRTAARRVAVEQQIFETCGLKVDLGDVQDTSRPPWRPLRDVRGTGAEIVILFERAIEEAQADEATVCFGRRLLDGGWVAACGSDAVASLADREAFYARLLYNDPENIGHILRLCRIYREQGRLHDALGLSDRAVRAHPQSVEALQRHGDILAALERADHARAYFERAAALQQSSNTVLPNRPSC